MLFSSISFLYYFLPLVLICYFILPFRLKNVCLLLFSLVFYFYGEPVYVFLMLGSTLWSYAHGLLIEKHRHSKWGKIFLWSSVAGSLLALGFFKYADFFIGNVNSIFESNIPLLKLALPIGISFYTFQTLSYTIDVYRGETPAQKSYIKLATYVTLFPQLIAGPIVRYTTVAEELEKRQHSLENFATGIRRFTVGLAKKVLIPWAHLRPHCTRCRIHRWPGTGSMRWRYLYSFILIFPATAIWPLALAGFLASTFWRILIIPLSLKVWRNFGGGGTFPLGRGSGTMCISPWAATGSARSTGSVISPSFGF